MRSTNRGRGGFGLGSLFVILLLGIAAFAALNAKDIERYMKLRSM
jgi:hypothetical protein